MLWSIVTYPLILLGLFRGAFMTYQSLEKDDKEIKKGQLEYWVVISALLFLFPKIDYILSFFLFSGLVGLIKFGLLFMVVVSKTRGYGFLYRFIDDVVISTFEPYIEDWIQRSAGVRTQVCSTAVLFLAFGQRSIIKMLMGSICDNHLYLVAKSMKKSIKDINTEMAKREEEDKNKQKTETEKDSKSEPNAKSIFEPHPTDEK